MFRYFSNASRRPSIELFVSTETRLDESLPVGSGTLAKTLRAVVPPQITIKCVNVRVLEDSDLRLQQVQQLDNVEFYSSNLVFAEAATTLPSVPSNLYYDAKLWSFIDSHGESGDVWWNVAR